MSKTKKYLDRLARQHAKYTQPIQIQEIVALPSTPRRPGEKAEKAASEAQSSVIERIYSYIETCANIAAHSHRASTKATGSERAITRLSFPEFRFYSSRPLSLTAFHHLCKKIEILCKSLPDEVHLVLGSFAVAERGTLLNLSLYASGGSGILQVHSKAYRHSADPSWSEEFNVFQKADSELRTHTVTAHSGEEKAGDSTLINSSSFCLPNESFLHCTQICYDHLTCHADAELEYLLSSGHQTYIPPAFSQMVISSSVKLDPSRYLGDDVTHTDPLYAGAHPHFKTATHLTTTAASSFGGSDHIFRLAPKKLSRLKPELDAQRRKSNARWLSSHYPVTLDDKQLNAYLTEILSREAPVTNLDQWHFALEYIQELTPANAALLIEQSQHLHDSEWRLLIPHIKAHTPKPVLLNLIKHLPQFTQSEQNQLAQMLWLLHGNKLHMNTLATLIHHCSDPELNGHLQQAYIDHAAKRLLHVLETLPHPPKRERTPLASRRLNRGITSEHIELWQLQLATPNELSIGLLNSMLAPLQVIPACQEPLGELRFCQELLSGPKPVDSKRAIGAKVTGTLQLDQLLDRPKITVTTAATPSITC